ncbi:hypothetical protein [Metabacillus rhizolycopersici]|uniref:Uncharacterized protein n=1 Tax=Metabacillus rhizolycopersici TaxID=2875709 RepID=A0ABS7UWL4_9BACI|nr:hypothetical protein [Metabacillus rhizolycopersici]MBZ5752706.1 hypothetical protein [Metabacillus rhizolycopersici]
MIIFIYTALIILYLISNFISDPFLSYIIGIIALFALFISLFHAKGLYLISGICFSSIGIYLFFTSDSPWYTFFLHFESMLGVLSLFLVLPFINSIIRVGRYDINLSLLLQHGVTRLSKLYRRSFLVCHFLGLFLNIATLPLLKSSLDRTLSQLSKQAADKFLTQNLLRAYALCLTWSPMEVMVSQSIDITGKEYYHIFPIMISIAIIIIISDWALSYFKHDKIPLVIEHKTEISLKKVYKKVLEMAFMLLIFILLVSLLQRVLDKGFLFSVVLLIVPISIVWALYIGKIKRYFSVTIPHWKERTRGLSNYFFMFLSAGLFVELLSLSGHLSFLQTAFSSVSDRSLLLYLSIGGYFLFTSLIGFHPLVSITLLTELLDPILPEISTISLTIVLIACSLSTVMYSPFNLSVSLLSDQLKINSYRMGIWNIPFAIFYMLVSIFIAYLLGFIL